jgi:homoaconitase/3-isopropylmalate dehydratase large subunit
MRDGVLQVFIEAGANVESSNCGSSSAIEGRISDPRKFL